MSDTDTDFQRYKNTPGAVYTESKFYDSLGRELEAAVCEFCQKRKPIRVWLGPDFSSPKFKEKYHVMMHEYSKGGQRFWVCNDCATDMINKSEGKDV